MGGFSDYLESQVLNQWFGRLTVTVPTTLYVALLTAVPTDAAVVELAASGYSRVAVPNTKSYWSTSSDGSEVSNLTILEFGPALQNWGEIPGFAIYDAATLGTELTHGEFAIPRTISNGDGGKIGPGSITIRFLDN